MKPEELKRFEIKESYVSEGINPDFIWYEASMIRTDMQANMARFERVVSVMEQRQKEYLKMLQDVMNQNREQKKSKEWNGLSEEEVWNAFGDGIDKVKAYAIYSIINIKLKERNK